MLFRSAGHLPRADALRTVEFRVMMKPSHADQLDALLAAQRDPRSPLFQRYLPSGEFARLFAPRPVDINALRNTFRHFGVLLRPSANALIWRARGSARDVERLFSTTLRVSGSGDGALVVADSPVTLPTALGSRIAGVVGLSRQIGRAHV